MLCLFFTSQALYYQRQLGLAGVADVCTQSTQCAQTGPHKNFEQRGD